MVVAEATWTEPRSALALLRRHAPVVACVVLALALRLPYAHAALGPDEGGDAAVAQQWLGSAHGELYGGAFLDRPPLLLLLYKVAIVGGPTGIRVLGAVAATALVVVVGALANALGGRRAGAIAALLTAVLTGSFALRAVLTYAELLAAVPAAASVLCLVTAHRRSDVRWLAVAGALAVSAALVKQSFLDAGLAGAAFLTATAIAQRRIPWREVTAYGAGAAVPVVAVAAWQVVAAPAEHGLLYALFGFRIAALQTLQDSSRPLLDRIQALEGPAVRSGLVAALIAAPIGLARLRGDRVLLATLAGWGVGCAIGVAGGGSYWAHYLIQVIAVSAIGAALLLAAVPSAIRSGALLGMLALTLVGGHSTWAVLRHGLPPSSPMVVGRWVHDHARPGDTQYVLYARANAGFYTGLRSPYPYAWSLMMRVIPDAQPRLRRLLASPRRPTWVIRWQPTTTIWHLDRHRRTQRLLRRHYVTVAVVHRRAILLRRDVARARGWPAARQRRA